jgi:hypothetical protein
MSDRKRLTKVVNVLVNLVGHVGHLDHSRKLQRDRCETYRVRTVVNSLAAFLIFASCSFSRRLTE